MKKINLPEGIENLGAALTFQTELSTIRRTTNSMGYTEARYNTMPSYATLHIVYKLNKEPKRKKQ